MEFYCHPTCTTCKKAQKWLDDQGIDYQWINLKENTPSKEKLAALIKNSDKTIKSFFNTSGKKYRELELKDKIPKMSVEKAAETLVSDGMLIKRPLVIEGKKVTVGFKEEEYEINWKASEGE